MGSDLQVLLGGERLFRSGAFLGMMIEAQFQGWPHDYANTFANIDRFLSGEVSRCSISINAVTPVPHFRAVRARHRCADADGSDALGRCALPSRSRSPAVRGAAWQYVVTRERLLKLVGLFDLFGLPDCAAELLLAGQDLTSPGERTQLLDLLVKSAGFDTTFEEHQRRFREQTKTFFPRLYRSPPAAPPSQPAPERPKTMWQSLRSRVRLRNRLSAMKRRLMTPSRQQLKAIGVAHLGGSRATSGMSPALRTMRWATRTHETRRFRNAASRSIRVSASARRPRSNRYAK